MTKETPTPGPQGKAPAIASDRPNSPPIRTTSQKIYGSGCRGDGDKPTIGSKKK